MNASFIILILLLIISIVTLISILIAIVKRHRQDGHKKQIDPGKHIPTDTPSISIVPSKIPGKSKSGLFFVYPEANGYLLDELKGENSLPSEEIIKENFQAIVSIGNSASKLVKPQDNRYKDRLDESFAYIENHYPDMRILRWMAYDFSTDSLFCRCNTNSKQEQCSKSTSDICKLLNDTDCVASKSCEVGVASSIKNDISKYNLKGILFDDEFPGSNSKIIPLFEKIKNSSNDLMIGWSGDIRSVGKGPSHKSEFGNNSTIWDYCLGQVYTSNTLNLYGDGGCSTFSSNVFWRNISAMNISYNRSIPVPTVCGSGDCQGDSNVDSTEFKCIDERLSQNQIESLIKTRPMANFAVWYGTHPKLKSGRAQSGCDPQQPDKCCFIGDDKLKECSLGCCDEWKSG